MHIFFNNLINSTIDRGGGGGEGEDNRKRNLGKEHVKEGCKECLKLENSCVPDILKIDL